MYWYIPIYHFYRHPTRKHNILFAKTYLEWAVGWQGDWCIALSDSTNWQVKSHRTRKITEKWMTFTVIILNYGWGSRWVETCWCPCSTSCTTKNCLLRGLSVKLLLTHSPLNCEHGSTSFLHLATFYPLNTLHPGWFKTFTLQCLVDMELSLTEETLENKK